MLKSPAKILVLWEKGTNAYKKANKLKEMEPQEEFHNKKILGNLKRLKAIAKKEETADVDAFNGLRDQTSTEMDKLRKLVKPKKDKAPPLRTLYKQICQLTLTVEALGLKDLDPAEGEVDETALDGVDPETLDKRDSQPHGLGNGPTATTGKPAVDDQAAELTKRFKTLLPDIREVQNATTSVKTSVQDHVTGFNDSMLHKKYDEAGKHLDALPALLKTGLQQISKTSAGLKKEGVVEDLEKQMDTEGVKSRLTRPTGEVKPGTEEEQKKDADIREGKSVLTEGKSIKSGSFGSVLMLDADNGTKLVVKKPTEPQYKVELELEQATYKELGEHPNLVKCYGMQKTSGGGEGLVLERVEGSDGQKALKSLSEAYKNNKVTYTEYFGMLQHITRGTLQGLAHMESCGFNHNDIKSDNIMIDKNTGQVKLIDIGMVSKHGEEPKLGHMKHNAPEKIHATAQTSEPSTDAFSTGQMLHSQIEGGWSDMWWTDDLKGTALKVDPELKKREPKKYAMETAYVEFLNKMLDPNPATRLKPSEALNHPFLRESLLDDESASKFTQGFMEGTVLAGKKTEKATIPVTVTPGFTQASWNQTISAATSSGAIGDASGMTAMVGEGLGKFAPAEADFSRLTRETQWPQKRQAGELAVSVLDEVRKGITNLLAKADFKDHPTLSAYLGQIDTEAKARRAKVVAGLQMGAPTITTANFKAAWQGIKANAEKAFKSAAEATLQKINTEMKSQVNPKQYLKDQLEATGLDKAKTAEKFFGFTENFSGALEDFEKAVTKNASNKEKEREKALAVANKYFTNMAAKNKALPAVQPDFRAPLLVALNDLTHSIKTK
jgi:serine/threonine protein kinase